MSTPTYDFKAFRAGVKKFNPNLVRDFQMDFLKGVVHEFRDGEAGKTGETVVMEVGYKKDKTKIKTEMTYSPFGIIGQRLSDEPELNLNEVQDRVEGFAYSYHNGFDPLTGEPLTGTDLDESQKSDLKTDAVGTKRNNVIPNLEIYKMLMDRIEEELE